MLFVRNGNLESFSQPISFYTKTSGDLVTRVVVPFKQFACFFFLPKSLSSSLKNALLCSDEPVFYLDSKSKCAPFSVIYFPPSEVSMMTIHCCVFIANVAIHLNDQVWDLHDHTCLLTVRPKAHKIRGDLAGRYWGRKVYWFRKYKIMTGSLLALDLVTKNVLFVNCQPFITTPLVEVLLLPHLSK